jgi:hypothetical protein
LPSIGRVPRGGRQRSGARRRNHALLPKDEPRRLPWRATSRAQRSSTVIRWEMKTHLPSMRYSSSTARKSQRSVHTQRTRARAPGPGRALRYR